MPALTLHRLKNILKQSYELGYFGCLSVKDSVVESLLEDLLENPAENPFPENEGWKAFTFREITKYKSGTFFEHSVRGKGMLEIKLNLRDSGIRFPCGIVYFVNEKSEPWTQPMRILHKGTR